MGRAVTSVTAGASCTMVVCKHRALSRQELKYLQKVLPAIPPLYCDSRFGTLHMLLMRPAAMRCHELSLCDGGCTGDSYHRSLMGSDPPAMVAFD